MRREAAVPLYYQVESLLRQKIRLGDLGSGTCLPGEEALAREYRVSRTTLRQALSSLEQDGLIIRKRGLGTFVSEKSLSVRGAEYSGSIEDLIAMTARTTVKLLSSGFIEAPERIRSHLGLEKGADVLVLEKVRQLDGSPFSYVTNYLPATIGRRLEHLDLSEKPLLVILEEDLGLKAADAIQTMEATVADFSAASPLEIRVGDPLIKAERTVFDTKGRQMEHVSVLYRADKYMFTVRLRRRGSETPSGWEMV
jgi:GntR family transcriptional regulator